MTKPDRRQRPTRGPESVAPPPQSVMPRAGPPPRHPAPAFDGPVATPVAPGRLTPTSIVVGAIALALGAADIALASGQWPTIALAVALALALIPWGAIVLRPWPSDPRRGGRSWRVYAFHLVNTTLVLAFTAAKVTVLSEAPRAALEHWTAYRTYTAAVVFLMLLGLVLRSGRVARLVALSAEQPARIMLLSFATASALGALVLVLPVCQRDIANVSLLDSLFLSISAVCVTGLSTVNVAEAYTFTGQLVLCVLMQIGGLGIMALTAAVTMLAGQRMGVKSSTVLAQMVDAASLADLKRTLRAIVLYTLVFEAMGALVLYAQFSTLPEVAETASSSTGPMAGAGSAAWAAIFHSVSAFCNGSLSNFRGGLMPFASHVGVCQTLAVLIVLGGLGFPVIHELALRTVSRLRGVRPRRISLNTRIALVTSAALLGGLAATYFVLERGASFTSLSLADQFNAAVFQSACARTSGFNVVDVAAMRPATLLLTCFAMFVGADPGSTSGGIKTTTLAVLFASYRGELRGQRPRLFDRTVPDAVVRRAIGVAFLSTVGIGGVVLVLSLTEPFDTLALFFEATSAFSTTGLSTGITPQLSIAGKVCIMLTMLFGRIGPLTAALALSRRGPSAAIELPEERVMIG